MKSSEIVSCVAIALILVPIIGFSWYMKYSEGVGFLYDVRTNGFGLPAAISIAIAVIYLVGKWLKRGDKR